MRQLSSFTSFSCLDGDDDGAALVALALVVGCLGGVWCWLARGGDGVGDDDMCRLDGEEDRALLVLVLVVKDRDVMPEADSGGLKGVVGAERGAG